MDNREVLQEAKRRLLSRSVKVLAVDGLVPGGGKPNVYMNAVNTKEIYRVLDGMIKEFSE